jgi:hypothetical protein
MSAAVEAALRDAGGWAAGVAGELGRSPWPVSAGVVVAGLAFLAIVAAAGLRMR